MTRCSRAVFDVFLVGMWLASGYGCGGGDCPGAACVDQASFTALVPPIGNSTWTLTACQNAECASVSMTAADANKAANGLTIGYSQAAGGWQLTVRKLATAPKDGDVWSLKISDETSAVVFDKQQAVTYETTGDHCQSCKTATVNL